MDDVVITPKMNDTYDVRTPGGNHIAWFLFGVTGNQQFVDEWPKRTRPSTNVSAKMTRKIVKALANSPINYSAPSHI